MMADLYSTVGHLTHDQSLQADDFEGHILMLPILADDECSPRQHHIDFLLILPAGVLAGEIMLNGMKVGGVAILVFPKVGVEGRVVAFVEFAMGLDPVGEGFVAQPI